MFIDTDTKELGEVQAPVRVLKLSEAIREAGYGKWSEPTDCVLGRAYKHVMGHSHRDRSDFGLPRLNYQQAAVEAFGVPRQVCEEAEFMCLDKKPASEIADHVKAQGY